MGHRAGAGPAPRTGGASDRDEIMATIAKTDVPVESVLRAALVDASFHDAYEVPLRNPALSPIGIFLHLFRTTPGWVSWLMAVRNRAAGWFGLKDVGALSAVSGKSAELYKVGDRLGIFSIFAMTDSELLLGIDDSHLDVRVSILKRGGARGVTCIVSTVVHVHNRLGRLYMLPVGRIHPIVVKAMIRRSMG